MIGSPTWWFRVSLPIRSYLKSPAARKVLDGKPFAGFSTSRRYWQLNVGNIRRFGEADGGRWIAETHFVATGNQVQSMLAWLSFMSGFTYFNKLLRLPPTNLQPGFESQARQFAERLADRTLGALARQRAERPGLADRATREEATTCRRIGLTGAVVVTGTSTGIGAATALHLAENGFHVFAGVRREADGEALKSRAAGRAHGAAHRHHRRRGDRRARSRR